MAYALAFADTAVEDTERLVDSLPEERRERALDAIEALCLAFAERPLHRSGRWSTPSFPLHFEVAGVRYYWSAAYRLSEDETTLIVTHVFRVAL